MAVQCAIKVSISALHSLSFDMCVPFDELSAELRRHGAILLAGSETRSLLDFLFVVTFLRWRRLLSDNYISMLNHLKCSSCFNGFSISCDAVPRSTADCEHSHRLMIYGESKVLYFFRYSRRAVCACQCRGLLQLDSKALSALERMKFNHRRAMKSLEKSRLIARRAADSGAY